jgi:hypothetical protein
VFVPSADLMAQAKDASLMVKAVLTSSRLPMASAPVMSGWLPRVAEGSIGEPRTGRRIHLDIMPTDRTRDEEVERLKGLGATKYEDHRKPDGTGWVTMADPEGNPVLRRAQRRRAGVGGVFLSMGAWAERAAGRISAFAETTVSALH